MTGNEGNHGEDVKEVYYYLDSTPTHSYMKMLYRYPHAPYPYNDLVTENRRRSVFDFEYELLDTGVFADDRYFDIVVEYAKSTPDDNETNRERLYDQPNASPFVKDAFHRYIINSESDAVNPAQEGTKVAAQYVLSMAPNEQVGLRLRLSNRQHSAPFADFEALAIQRRSEADAFYAAIQPRRLSDDERTVQRQALAGMLWSKQLYYYDVEQWLNGDPAGSPPPPERKRGRNHEWDHLNNFDVISIQFHVVGQP